MKRALLFLLPLAATATRGQPPRDPAQPTTLLVHLDRKGAAISETLFGVFYEDINFAADGGLYPERVKNRSFEFPDPLMAWHRAGTSGSGSFAPRSDAPISPKNPQYLRLTAATGTFGVTNDGFRGIGVQKDARYTVSFFARAAGTPPAALRVEVENTRNQAFGSVSFAGLTSEWRRYSATLVPERTEARARLRVAIDAPGTLDIDVISLYPEDTWAGRSNGLRKDLVQLLSDLQPGFLRFPGGCVVEGRFLDKRYRWKTTLGDVAERELLINRWNNEFPFRPAPDYFQTFGLGFFEYFQLAEDIGAEPLPVLSCGMACQFNSGELAPLEELGGYIQDALDLVEFANGPVTSAWGKKRAEMGHPKPFGLKLLGVGNENWGKEYVERYERFAKVLKAKHPEIRLISSAGPFAGGEQFQYLWRRLRELNADLVDEHYYMPPEWFLSNVHRYDGYPRTGPKVFAGEFAAHARDRRSTLRAALAEAAFMTGLERNADVVEMAAYAPLFAHVDAWQWSPNLIWFDNLRSYGTPSYYVQQLFSRNRAGNVVPLSIDGSPKNGESGVYGSAGFDARANELVLKLVNTGAAPRSARIEVAGASPSGRGRQLVLTGEPDAENSLESPKRVAPAEQTLDGVALPFAHELPPHSLTVLRLALQ
jgi:alpha-N-arabinofuranosidase